MFRALGPCPPVQGKTSIIALLVVLGQCFVLGALDIIRTGERAPVGSRVFIGVLGITLLAWGAVALWRLLGVLVAERGRGSAAVPLVRLAGFLGSRVTLRSTLAALPELLTAAACFVAWKHDRAVPFCDRETLLPLMQLEFFVIHGTALVGALLVLPVARQWQRGLQGLGSLGLVALYLLAVRSVMGQGAMFVFAYLMAVRFVPMLLNRTTDAQKWAVGFRWWTSVVLFMGLVMWFDRSLSTADNLPFGFFYFLATGVIEAFDYYNVRSQRVRWESGLVEPAAARQT